MVLLQEIYCPEQIVIPENFHLTLKQYAKAVIRTQPFDLLRWSAAYFRCLALSVKPPVKVRYEPPVRQGSLTKGIVRVLIDQLGKGYYVQKKMLLEKWEGLCLPEDLAETAEMICEMLTEDPDGGAASVPLWMFRECFLAVADLDSGLAQKFVNGRKVLDDDTGALEEEQMPPALPKVLSTISFKNAIIDKYRALVEERRKSSFSLPVTLRARMSVSSHSAAFITNDILSKVVCSIDQAVIDGECELSVGSIASFLEQKTNSNEEFLAPTDHEKLQSFLKEAEAREMEVKDINELYNFFVSESFKRALQDNGTDSQPKEIFNIFGESGIEVDANLLEAKISDNMILGLVAPPPIAEPSEEPEVLAEETSVPSAIIPTPSMHTLLASINEVLFGDAIRKERCEWGVDQDRVVQIDWSKRHINGFHLYKTT
uniref:RIIa domain-containing protein n=1 Tax=Anopheles farauti TaxID=69004 RepID=A0A182QPT1_9DIPT